jgi:Domain of unknown function (DUF4157)
LSFQKIRKQPFTKKKKDSFPKNIPKNENYVLPYVSTSDNMNFDFSDIGIFDTDRSIQRKRKCPRDGTCPKFITKSRNNDHIMRSNIIVTQPNDPLEREADRVAERIVSMNCEYCNPKKSNVNKGREIINPKCKICEEEEGEELEKIRISRNENESSSQDNEISDHLRSDINKVITDQGSPLDTSTREFMESRFGYDFSDTRVHNDSKSDELAALVNASAFTFGNNIFLSKYESITDKRLLAHELTHIVQQSLEPVRNTSNYLSPYSEFNSGENLSYHIRKRPLALRSSLMQSYTLYRQPNKRSPKKSGPKVLRFEAHANATYDYGGKGFRINGAKKELANACSCREGERCVRATGTLGASFRVTTKSTLPSVPQGLTACQQRRVTQAIFTDLAPHEQAHVKAYRMYNADWFRPYDLTLCENELERRLNDIFENEERTRRTDAEAASRALDPHYVDVDLDC